MKQFIVLAAVLPLLLLFFAQSQLDRMNDRRVFLAERAVHAFEVEACAYGEMDVDGLRARLAKIFAAAPADVAIELTGGEGGQAYYYSIRVPMGKLMAGGGLLGLDEAQNKGAFTAEGEIIDLPARVEALVEAAKPQPEDPPGGGGDDETISYTP